MTVVEEILPIGASLKNLSVHTNCKEQAGFNLIVLTFKPTQYLVLQPLASTDIISISPWLSYERKRVIRLLTNPKWAQPLIGSKLNSVWLDENESDRRQIVFNFDSYILSFLVKNSVLKVSLHKQSLANKVSFKQKLRIGSKISLIKKHIPLLG